MAGIAVVGASNDRSKFGNKAVRALILRGKKVFPINPKEKLVEGIAAYPSLSVLLASIPKSEQTGIEVYFYVPPAIGEKILDEMKKLGLKEVVLPPGSESESLISKAKKLGIKTVLTCPIRELGLDPDTL